MLTGRIAYQPVDGASPAELRCHWRRPWQTESAAASLVVHLQGPRFAGPAVLEAPAEKPCEPFGPHPPARSRSSSLPPPANPGPTTQRDVHPAWPSRASVLPVQSSPPRRAIQPPPPLRSAAEPPRRWPQPDWWHPERRCAPHPYQIHPSTPTVHWSSSDGARPHLQHPGCREGNLPHPKRPPPAPLRAPLPPGPGPVVATPRRTWTSRRPGERGRSWRPPPTPRPRRAPAWSCRSPADRTGAIPWVHFERQRTVRDLPWLATGWPLEWLPWPCPSR
mmetsp:Transcript_16832/g.28759  ORF Transcript_16832/g.28759 Transcript_16832/m.28759 type:complete len:277 (+) Transcript_16832:117-947(+)